MSSSKQRSPYARQVRNALIKTTASEPNPNPMLKRCSVWGCGESTQAFAGKGLSQSLCSKHVRHLSRHGSAHCNSYKASDMKPYLWAVERWLRENKDVALVKRITAMFDALLHGAGKPETAMRMLRAPAKDKAKVALARMRVRGIKPVRLLSITLATHAVLQDDQSMRHQGKEFLHVQIARQAHRLAARYVPVAYVSRGFGDEIKGGGLKFGHQIFPSGTGIIMRQLGAQIDAIGEHLVDLAVPHVLELKRTRFGQHASRQPLANATNGAKL
jgi:hypothetical protein